MYEYHARPNIFHHCPDFLAVSHGITVYLAFTATCLTVSLGAMIKTLMCIIQEAATLITQVILFLTMLLITIYGNHLADHRFLTFYAFHKSYQSRYLAL